MARSPENIFYFFMLIYVICFFAASNNKETWSGKTGKTAWNCIIYKTAVYR